MKIVDEDWVRNRIENGGVGDDDDDDDEEEEDEEDGGEDDEPKDHGTPLAGKVFAISGDNDSTLSHCG